MRSRIVIIIAVITTILTRSSSFGNSQKKGCRSKDSPSLVY